MIENLSLNAAREEGSSLLSVDILGNSLMWYRRESHLFLLKRGRDRELTVLWWLRRCLPAMLETQVRSLGREDPLEKEMATHSSILAWKIPWMEPGGLQSMGSQRARLD